MRALAELGPLRPTFQSALCWPMLLTLHAEQDGRGGQAFTESIFTIGFSADIPAFRVRPLLEQLRDANANAFEADESGRMMTVEVL